MNKEKQLLEGVLLDKELNVLVGRKLINTQLDANNNIINMGKLACVIKMVISLDELDNTDTLEDGGPSNVLLMCYVTGSEDFISFEPASSTPV